jgi:hypothetical protein
MTFGNIRLSPTLFLSMCESAIRWSFQAFRPNNLSRLVAVDLAVFLPGVILVIFNLDDMHDHGRHIEQEVTEAVCLSKLATDCGHQVCVVKVH